MSRPPTPRAFAPVDREAADNIRRTTNEDDLPSVMMKRMLGLSAATAREIVARSEGGNLADGANALLTEEIRPVCYYDGEKPLDFSFCDYATESGERKSFPTLSAAMDEFYAYGAQTGEKATAENAVRRTLNAALDKQRKKLGVFLRESEGARDFEKERKLGELITANLHRIAPGSRSVVVDDWYDGGELEIKLTEPTPQEDAQKHFKRYQKKKLHDSQSGNADSGRARRDRLSRERGDRARRLLQRRRSGRADGRTGRTGLCRPPEQEEKGGRQRAA